MSPELPPALRAPVRALLAAQRVILFTCSLFIGLIFFFVVILRYVFEADLFAYEEWVLMAAFWLYFIGGAQGSYENSHIKADFINAWVRSPRIKWTIAMVTLGLELLVGLVLSYWAVLMVLEDVAKYPDWPATIAWKIPFAAPRLGICLGLMLMTFYTALHLYVGFAKGPGPGEREAPGRC